MKLRALPQHNIFFLNMGQSRPLFVYFRSFLIPITISIIQIEKSIDVVLGIRTRGRRMEGKDETTEPWRHPHCFYYLCTLHIAISGQYFSGQNLKRFVTKGLLGGRHSSMVSSAPTILHRGFESQAHHLGFFQFVLLKLRWVKGRK